MRFCAAAGRPAILRCLTALLGATLFVLLAVAPAVAQPANDRTTCEKASGDVAIMACTRAIESEKFKGHALAPFVVVGEGAAR
jgi:hypothetical protein